MNLISIQIENLASIKDAFIDFTQSPLAETGLFAITGDTGAGKSTILDAICLALYGKTARLRNDQKLTVDFNGDDIKLNDPRHLLRRGCAVASCSVKFIGNDNLHYQATWRVSRARGKIDGRLQSATHQLFDADEQLIAEKSQTTKVIESVLGLNFEQFTRAVMLAQHEFSAFLKASADERAQLLERLTGSDKFSRLGQLIFERHKAKKQELDLQKARLGDFALLSEEELEDLKSQSFTLHDQLGTLNQKQQALIGISKWYEADGQFVDRLGQSQTQLEAAQIQWDLRLHEFDKAKQSDAAQAIAENRSQLQRLKAKQALLRVELQQLQQQDWLQALDTQRQTVSKCEQEAHRVQALFVSAKPIAAQVTELDKERHVKEVTLQQWQKHAEQAHQQLTKIQSKMTGFNVEGEQIHTGLMARRAELMELDPIKHLVSEWASTVVELENLAACHETQKQLATRKMSLLEQQTQQQTQQQSLFDHAQVAKRELALQTEALDSLSHQLQRFDIKKLQADALLLDKIHTAVEQCIQLETFLLQQHSEEKQIAMQLAALEYQLKDTQQQVLLSQERVSSAEKHLQQVQFRSSEQVSHLRAQLQAGKECMVCGSTHHPYAVEHINDHWRALLSDFEQEVSKAKAALTQSQQRYEHHLVRKEQTQAHLQHLANQIAQTKQQLITQQQHVHQVAERLQLHGAIEQTELSRLKLTNEQHLNDYHQLTERQTVIRTREQQLRTLAEEKELAHQHCANQLLAVQTQIASLQEQEQQVKARNARSIDALQHVEDTLSRFGDLRSEPKRVAQLSSDAVLRYQTLTEQLQQLEHEHQLLQQQTSQLSQQALQLETESARASHEIELNQQAVIQLAKLRSSLIPLDASATQWLEQKEHDWHIAQEQWQLAQSELQLVVKKKDEHALILVNCTDNLARIDEELNDNATHYQSWLVSFMRRFNLEDVNIDSLLAMTCEQRETLLQLAETLKDQITNHKLVIEQIQAQIAHHQNTRPELTQEQLTDALLDSQNEVEQCQSALLVVKTQLATHEQNTLRMGELQAKVLTMAEQYECWALLDKLLGDATGKKLRNLAQVQTLRLLLVYANQHLKSLTKRYRLCAIGQSLDIAIIDRDMADEQRTISTLSGGESFLVSLALALGLASLSSHQVKIGSLFIDEGFGTLDPETLSVALDALDALQAQGRKVGVISHVSQMSERIGTQIQVKKGAAGQSSVQVIQQ